MKRAKWFVGAWMVAAILAGGGAANVFADTTVSIPDARDTFMMSYLSEVYDDLSAWAAVNVGGVSNGLYTNRMLLSFDLSSIPTNAIIQSANLRLVGTGNNGDTEVTLSLYPMITDWTNLACWFGPNGAATPWNAPGAGSDYVTAPSSSLTSTFLGSNSSRVDFTFTNLVQDVQSWVSNPASNKGWIVISSDEANNFKQIVTRESPAGFGWDGTPMLDIVYTLGLPVVTIPDSKDTFMMSYPTEIYDDLSAWAAANVGGVSNGLYTNRMLLNFDLSSIPANAVIQSANLRLVGTGNNGETAVTLSLYPMITDWTNTACWFGPNGATTPWNAAGAGSDYVPTPSSSLTSTFLGSNTSRVDFTFDNLVQDVQQWVSDPGSNKGWIVISSDEANNWKQIATRESALPAPDGWGWDGMPKLDITYTLGLPRVALPTFSPAGGSYSLPQSVTLSCATENATIYYTTDNTAPTTSSLQFHPGSPITVDHTMTLKAKAFADGYADSAVATAAYNLLFKEAMIPQCTLSLDGNLSDWPSSMPWSPPFVWWSSDAGVPALTSTTRAKFAWSEAQNVLYVAVQTNQQDNGTDTIPGGHLVVGITKNPATAVPITNVESTQLCFNYDTTQPNNIRISSEVDLYYYADHTNGLTTGVRGACSYDAGTGMWTYELAIPFWSEWVGCTGRETLSASDVVNVYVVMQDTFGTGNGTDLTFVGNPAFYMGADWGTWSKTATLTLSPYSYTASDLAAMMAAMDSKPSSGNWNAAMDLDGDGGVTSTDLSILLVHMQ